MLLLTPLLALADDPAPPADAPPPADTPADGPIPLTNAEDLGVISRKDLRQLKPSPFHLPPNPRGQVDFTAYTLEWGEVKLGLANITVGVLPHVQLGTSVPLDVLRVPNFTAKAHLTEKGVFDIAVYGNYYLLMRPAVTASYLSVGTISSVEVNRNWSLHLGGGYVHVGANGSVDFSSLAGLFSVAGAPTVVPFSFAGDAVNLTVATDVRLNRRDSLILRGESMLWAQSDSDVPAGLGTLVGLDGALAADGFMTPDKAYAATLAWQFAWEHIELRVGAGISSAPWGWLLQSVELDYRFGGPTRLREAKQRGTWNENVDSTEVERRQAERDAREAKRKAKKSEKR